ncbi:MAG TPA: cupin domain-containing protein [Pyrinomonadaceae bacterium]|jgi:quercetin dioxygenase-like cupin family protein|nr:cupin domain-containing protein [Pyrinomonadaceae bacterium]
MTFGTTEGKPWVEALPTERGAFTGRTFSRFHIVDGGGSVPTVGEVWATSDHAVESHAHDADELLYVLSGAIEINGRKLRAGEVVFIPRGTSYAAGVLSDEGAHVLRVELPNAGSRGAGSEYGARVWQGALTDDGVPRLAGTAGRRGARAPGGRH